MRWLIPAFVLAGCGTEEGSLLTIHAPDGPNDVARLEIVLASPKPEAITTIEQRITPTNAVAEEGVRYYRQLATAGAIAKVGTTDGFTVRIEPNPAMTNETTFIPFLIAYDRQDNVIGVGAVLDANGEPTSIMIESTVVRQYIVAMTPLVPMDPAMGMRVQESIALACATGPSGIAWRPVATQLRLLFPDPENDTFDATSRAADLDCDGYVAPDQDCDDLRAAVHVGQREVCDGVDSNCDGAWQMVRACDTTQCSNGGVELCDDRTGEAIGACVANAQCACQGGACASCAVSYRNTSTPNRPAPCAPAVGKMHVASCTAQAPCTIEVVAGDAWHGYVGTNLRGPYSTKISNVNTGEVYLQAKLAGDVVGSAGDSVGTLNLVITQGATSQLLPVDMRLLEAPAVAQCDPIEDTGLHLMSCTP